uniref:mucin-2 n=1 Tax=Semicossyphus pulcher TaxID=241346 RepID=UPI0037E93AD1
MCDHSEKDHKRGKSANSKSQQMKHRHQNQGQRHQRSQQKSHQAEEIDSHDLSTAEDSIFSDHHSNQTHHLHSHHYHRKQNHRHVSLPETPISSSTGSSSSSTSSSSSSSSSPSSSTSSSSSSSSFSSSSTTSSSSSSLSSQSSSECSERFPRMKHSQSCTDISRKYKYLEEGEDTAPLIDKRGYQNTLPARLERGKGKSSKGGALKSARTTAGGSGTGGSFRKTKSMEALTRPRDGEWHDDGKDPEKEKSEARKNLMKEKMKFSAFLNEITRQVLSPMRLSTLGVTDAHRPCSPGQARSRPTSADSLSSRKHTRDSSPPCRSDLHHHHHHQRHHHGGSTADSQVSLSHTAESAGDRNSDTTTLHVITITMVTPTAQVITTENKKVITITTETIIALLVTITTKTVMVIHVAIAAATALFITMEITILQVIIITVGIITAQHIAMENIAVQTQQIIITMESQQLIITMETNTVRPTIITMMIIKVKLICIIMEITSITMKTTVQRSTITIATTTVKTIIITIQTTAQQLIITITTNTIKHIPIITMVTTKVTTSITKETTRVQTISITMQTIIIIMETTTVQTISTNMETISITMETTTVQTISITTETTPLRLITITMETTNITMEITPLRLITITMETTTVQTISITMETTTVQTNSITMEITSITMESTTVQTISITMETTSITMESATVQTISITMESTTVQTISITMESTTVQTISITMQNTTLRLITITTETTSITMESTTVQTISITMESTTLRLITITMETTSITMESTTVQTISINMETTTLRLITITMETTNITVETLPLRMLQEQNEGLHKSLLKTAVRMECLGEEFISSQKLLETELQRTRMELNNLTERFKRLHDNCSSTQQTNSLLEQRLHLVAQSMEGERERLNRRISALTEKLADTKHANSVETFSGTLLLHTNEHDFQPDDTINQVVHPITPPPVEFMDSHNYGKAQAGGQELPLGSVPEEEESDWSELGEETPRFILTGSNRGPVWRHQEGDMDKDSELVGEEIFRCHSPRPLQIPHLQFTIHSENLSGGMAGEGTYRIATSPTLGSAILIRSASMEDIPLSHHEMQKERRGTEAMMDLHHRGGAATEDLDNQILHHWRGSNDIAIARPIESRMSEAESGLAGLQSAELMLNHFICEHQTAEGQGRAEVHGWTGGIPDEVWKGERTQL